MEGTFPAPKSKGDGEVDGSAHNWPLFNNVAMTIIPLKFGPEIEVTAVGMSGLPARIKTAQTVNTAWRAMRLPPSAALHNNDAM